MADQKLPYIQFFPSDWLRDQVSGCSLAAQALWMRLMFIMHDSAHYGYLELNGSPIPSVVLARRTGCDTLEQYDALLCELDSVGVPSRTSNGIIFSRRMVRDEKNRLEKRADWRWQKRNQRKTLKNNGTCPQNVRTMSGQSPPVSSSSSSSSELKTKPTPPPPPEAEGEDRLRGCHF